ncbi:MAG: response regulator transcription factor [Bacteroidota bacterium]
MIHALLIDDHQLLIQGMKALFTAEDGIEIAEATHNGHEAPELLASGQFDILLLDISMPILEGPGVLRLLKEQEISTPVLMLTMHQDIKHIRRTLELGAMGYILKDAHKEELQEAIEKVAAGKNYFHPKIQDEVFAYFAGRQQNAGTEVQLSKREIEIIAALAEGTNSEQIAEKLFISKNTVRTHRRNIMQKVGVKTSAELIHIAMERGWI